METKAGALVCILAVAAIFAVGLIDSTQGVAGDVFDRDFMDVSDKMLDVDEYGTAHFRFDGESYVIFEEEACSE